MKFTYFIFSSVLIYFRHFLQKGRQLPGQYASRLHWGRTTDSKGGLARLQLLVLHTTHINCDGELQLMTLAQIIKNLSEVLSGWS